MRLASLLLAACFLPATAIAQPASAPVEAPATAERMAPFAWLVGEWHGSGWFVAPDGSRHTFESREGVTPKRSGNALLVEGRHHPAGQPDRIMHDAIALLTWDSRAGAYRMRTALANGQGGDFPVEPGPNGLTWRIDTPGGAIVYTITNNGGVWIERGSRTGPDGQSVDFFEMALRKR